MRERTVQEAATQWLEADVGSREPFLKTTSVLEARVRSDSELGRGRADGLVAALSADNTIYTASLEAKSSLTRREIMPNYADGKLLTHAAFFGSVVCAVSVFFVLALSWSMWKWAIPVTVFLLFSFGFLVAANDLTRYRSVSVVKQAQQYPADEQWIALPTDVWNRLNVEEKRVLKIECERARIGLVRVSPGKRVFVLMRARPNVPLQGTEGYLVCYSRGDNLVSAMSSSFVDNEHSFQVPPSV